MSSKKLCHWQGFNFSSFINKGWLIQPILGCGNFVVYTIPESGMAINIQSLQDCSFATTKWFNVNSPG